MKKKTFFTLAAAAALLSAGSAQSKTEYTEGPLEISGNITVLAAYQHDNIHSNPLGSEGSFINALDSVGMGQGIVGDFRGPSGSEDQLTGDRDTFNFYLDQAEVDISRSFGENTRIRLDIDFGRGLSGTIRNVVLEQAYVTWNLGIGNGLEMLMGRFNAPIGLESVDRSDNIAISYSNIFRFVRPHNVTGLKFYYAFNEHIDLHVYAVNNLWDAIDLGGYRDNPVPSWGARVGFTWGNEGREHVVGLSYAGGPEAVVGVQSTATPSFLDSRDDSSLTHIVDLDFSFHITEKFIVAGEAVYRMDMNDTDDDNGTNDEADDPDGSACYVVNHDDENCTVFAGQLLLGYQINENWDVYGRYEYLNDVIGNYTGLDQQLHTGTLGVGYQITDGAKLKLEYRLDYGIPDEDLEIRDSDGDFAKTLSHGGALQVSYDF